MNRLFLIIILLISVWLIPYEADAGLISKAAKVGKIVKKATDAAVNATEKIIVAPVKFAVDPNGFIILNSSTRHILSARNNVREQVKCENKVKLTSDSIVYEEPNINSPQRLVFQQGEVVCVKSDFFGWTETPFGWVSLQ